MSMSDERCYKCQERGCGGWCVSRAGESRWDELRRLLTELEREVTADQDVGKTKAGS